MFPFILQRTLGTTLSNNQICEILPDEIFEQVIISFAEVFGQSGTFIKKYIKVEGALCILN